MTCRECDQNATILDLSETEHGFCSAKCRIAYLNRLKFHVYSTATLPKTMLKAATDAGPSAFIKCPNAGLSQ